MNDTSQLIKTVLDLYKGHMKGLHESITALIDSSLSVYDDILTTQTSAVFEAFSKYNSVALENLSAALNEYTLHVLEESNYLVMDSVSIMNEVFKNIDFDEILLDRPASQNKLNLQLFAEDANDYVIIDECAVKKFTFPEKLAIPIGKNKIQISTNTFLTLIGTIIAIVSLILAIQNNVNSSKKQDEYYESKLQLDQEENELLYEQNLLLQELINSADVSNSSQKEFFEDIRSAVQESASVPDEAQSTENNNPE